METRRSIYPGVVALNDYVRLTGLVLYYLRAPQIEQLNLPLRRLTIDSVNKEYRLFALRYNNAKLNGLDYDNLYDFDIIGPDG